MNNIEIDNIKEISLLVVMDSIKLNKTVVYHDLFLLWSQAFENMDIHYISDVGFINQLGCAQEKNVFGKKYKVISPRMYVICNEKLIEEQKRINNKSIKKLYIKALELKFEKFIKKIKNSVDIPNILW